ncbi:hypothetical protein FY122_09250 [Dictyoglomus thermophilum]|uniref:Uncharacterized protein n=2 Tax=Pseudomonadati TaxID=3379134 RepID=A0A7C4NWQ5_9BACT|nr:hypothetical protein [Dictyoglomus thermophilum]TYT20928.1 hypothetical protein FY122_09250 [Dictyoglomus thermophilum]
MDFYGAKDFILTILDTYPKEYGKIVESNNTQDERLIIIIKQNPKNIKVYFSILPILKYLINMCPIGLIAIEGGVEGKFPAELNSLLFKTIPDNKVKRLIVEKFFRRGLLTPAEYLHILDDIPFVLYGPEEASSYLEGLELFFVYNDITYYMEKSMKEDWTPLGLFKKYKNAKNFEKRFYHEVLKVLYGEFWYLKELGFLRAKYYSLTEARDKIVVDTNSFHQVVTLVVIWLIVIFLTDLFYKNIEIMFKTRNKEKVKFIRIDISKLDSYYYRLEEIDVGLETLGEIFYDLKNMIPFREYDKLLELVEALIKFPDFSKVRSIKIVKNLLEKMEELKVDSSIFICTPYFSDYVKKRLKEYNISYVVIEPEYVDI